MISHSMFFLLALYLVISQLFLYTAKYFNYIINPVFWIIVSLILFLTNSNKLYSQRINKKCIYSCTAAFLFYIIIYSLSGLAVTFGKNPYANNLKGVLINFWITAIPIIGKEISRYFLIKNNKKLYTTNNILIIFIFMMYDFNVFSYFTQMTSILNIFKILIVNLIPVIIKNILFAQIVYKATPAGNIIYEVGILFYLWISPILSNVPWILSAIMDISIPLLLLIFVQNVYEAEYQKATQKKYEKVDYTQTVIGGGLLILCAFFSVGVLPIHMKAIATGSMYPEIHVGDAVIVLKTSINDLNIGDVIEYKIENQSIIHRIIKKELVNGTWEIITKGDNNKSEDAKPVYEGQIEGKVIFKIKYIGLPSYYLHLLLNSKETVLVETGQ